MKKTFVLRKSAFSLIELSIVLIIIGLLIAGITGGASLIRSAELRAVMGEYRGYSTAVNGFYVQYNQLPGDYKATDSSNTIAKMFVIDPVPNSNTAGDGMIEYYTAIDAKSDAFTATVNSESTLAWHQLMKTGGLDNVINTLNDLTITDNVNKVKITVAQTIGTSMPASRLRNAGWHFDYRNNPGAAVSYSTTSGTAEGAANIPAYQNVVVLTKAPGVSSASSTLVNGTVNVAAAALTGPDALSIDTRIDDGFANAGRVRGINPGTYSANGCYTPGTTNVSYNVASNSNPVCALSFQVDPNS